jgi:PadR family transcriptional regulator PadR
MLIPRMPKQEATRDAELLQGTLDMLILKICALEPLHGYGIVQRLYQISRESLNIRQGSLYPALYRLENKGLLKAEWRTTEGGRDAKYYSLTKAGRRQLEEEQESWKRSCEAISFVLDTTDRSLP